ncbi:unnamed protein product [Linum tenue]|uniref:Poly(A) RNA polymerase mitochondrial-like central palm domain-containing protein n=1 Tax=Linum tenue TaxID=586396 RepID=A0AAV0JQ56_9ROSI|nr:unnamed protein product [Linum tenue]
MDFLLVSLRIGKTLNGMLCDKFLNPNMWHRFLQTKMNAPLESTLWDILGVIEPQRDDWLIRQRIVQELQDVVRTIPNLRGATVEPFGSFVSNLFTPWGDLDITVMLDYGSYISVAGKKRKLSLLEDVLRALKEKGGWWRLRFIPNAKVPILKFEKGCPAISGDISIDNLGGQMKSKCLFWLNQIDGRFRPLVLLVKEWAKTHNINNPKCGTLNSYSLSLLVVFHFQTCKPAIFPPFHALYPTNVVDDLTGVRETAEQSISDLFHANIRKYIAGRSRTMNRSSLSELFVSFLAKSSFLLPVFNHKSEGPRLWNLPVYWAVGRDKQQHKMVSQDFCALCSFLYPSCFFSIICFFFTFYFYFGGMLLFTFNSLNTVIYVQLEDPFEQPANSARAVSVRNLDRIQEVIQRTQLAILSPSLSWIDIHPLLVKPELSRVILFRKQNQNSGGQMMQLQQQQQPQIRKHVHSLAPVIAARVQNARSENQLRGWRDGTRHIHELSSKPKQETASNNAVSKESNAKKWRKRGIQQQQRGDVFNSKQQLWRARSQQS